MMCNTCSLYVNAYKQGWHETICINVTTTMTRISFLFSIVHSVSALVQFLALVTAAVFSAINNEYDFIPDGTYNDTMINSYTLLLGGMLAASLLSAIISRFEMDPPDIKSRFTSFVIYGSAFLAFAVNVAGCGMLCAIACNRLYACWGLHRNTFCCREEATMAILPVAIVSCVGCVVGILQFLMLVISMIFIQRAKVKNTKVN